MSEYSNEIEPPFSGDQLPATVRVNTMRTAIALQSTVDALLQASTSPTHCSLTICGTVSIDRVKLDRELVLARWRKLYPNYSGIWVMAAHPRPHIHLLINKYIPKATIEGLLPGTCFGITDVDELDLSRILEFGYQYLVQNLWKTVQHEVLPKSARKWGTFCGSNAPSGFRVGNRSVELSGTSSDIWKRFGHHIWPNDSEIRLKYFNYLWRFYSQGGDLSDEFFLTVLEAETPPVNSDGWTPQSWRQFRQRYKFAKYTEFLNTYTPEGAFLELQALDRQQSSNGDLQYFAPRENFRNLLNWFGGAESLNSDYMQFLRGFWIGVTRTAIPSVIAGLVTAMWSGT